MFSLFRRVMKNQHGASVVEITMVVSLIAVAAIASMRSVSSKVSIVLATLN
jgi:pilus assembly protein Flp/PilA